MLIKRAQVLEGLFIEVFSVLGYLTGLYVLCRMIEVAFR